MSTRNFHGGSALAACCVALVWTAAVGAESPSPAGAWRGESKCLVRPSGCNDEDSLYRITATGNSNDRAILSANKIVSGREVNMGESECRYDGKARTLDCPLPNGNSMHFELNGDALEGKFTLANGTLWRKISLRRVSEK